MSSVNSTGSNALDPYTSDVDLRMTRRTDGAFWQAANSWIAPITLSSFNAALPPERGAYDAAAACTTVSTSPLRITLAMNGLRMSARTNSARPIRRSRSLLGAIASTAMTWLINGFCASRAVRYPPRNRHAPVTSTTLG